MRHINRTLCTRISALILALMLLLSCTASYAAASFSKSGAGVKYKGTFKLGSTTTETALKKAFGKYTRLTDDGCTFGYATYMYKFKSKGINIETLQKKKNGKEQIITITITKRGVPTIGGLKVGDKASSIMSIYGKNYKINKSKTNYLYKAGSYYLEIKTKNDKVSKITILWDL